MNLAMLKGDKETKKNYNAAINGMKGMIVEWINKSLQIMIFS